MAKDKALGSSPKAGEAGKEAARQRELRTIGLPEEPGEREVSHRPRRWEA